MASNFQQKTYFLVSLPGARFQNAWLKLAFALLAEDLISPVAIVESEKTAKLEILRNRRVVAFPDPGAYDIWKQKATQINFPIRVSDYLEKNATEEQKKQGLDIADFLCIPGNP